jgi:hypothetical protein
MPWNGWSGVHGLSGRNDGPQETAAQLRASPGRSCARSPICEYATTLGAHECTFERVGAFSRHNPRRDRGIRNPASTATGATARPDGRREAVVVSRGARSRSTLGSGEGEAPAEPESAPSRRERGPLEHRPPGIGHGRRLAVPCRIVDPPYLACLALGSFGRFRRAVLGSFGRFSSSGAGPWLCAGLRTPPGSRTEGLQAPPTIPSPTGATHLISVAFRWVRSTAFEGSGRVRSLDFERRRVSWGDFSTQRAAPPARSIAGLFTQDDLPPAVASCMNFP